jgi:hypothetical protein
MLLNENGLSDSWLAVTTSFIEVTEFSDAFIARSMAV